MIYRKFWNRKIVSVTIVLFIEFHLVTGLIELAPRVSIVNMYCATKNRRKSAKKLNVLLKER